MSSQCNFLRHRLRISWHITQGWWLISGCPPDTRHRPVLWSVQHLALLTLPPITWCRGKGISASYTTTQSWFPCTKLVSWLYIQKCNYRKYSGYVFMQPSAFEVRLLDDICFHHQQHWGSSSSHLIVCLIAGPLCGGPDGVQSTFLSRSTWGYRGLYRQQLTWEGGEIPPPESYFEADAVCFI